MPPHCLSLTRRFATLIFCLLAADAQAAIDAQLLQGLAARGIGPAAVSGRISAIDAVNAACTSALADFKRPREVRILEEFPRATLEKIAKAELRRMLADG